MQSQTLKEIGVLDSLRGFAAFSVMIYHYVCTTNGYITSPFLQTTFDNLRSGVQLFFVISGFILPWSMMRSGYKLTNFFKFFLKRLSRLEPPYIFSIIGFLLLFYVRAKVTGTHESINAGRVGAHFFYLVPFFKDYSWLNKVYWTLAIEFQYYLFIALIFPLLISKKVFFRFIIYAFCLTGPWMLNGEFLPYSLPFFLMGIVLFLRKEGLISTKEFVGVIIACMLVSYLTNTTDATIFAFSGTLVIYFWPQKKPKVLSALGKMSYSIYLFHPLIGGSLVNILSHRYTEPYQKVLVIVAGVMATLLSSAIVYYFVERPSKRLASSIKY